MKAIVYDTYGSPDVLRLEEVDKPSPGANDVVIDVRAASVNPLDWHYMRGLPYFLRVMTGPRKPKFTGLGIDVAGTIAAVGSSVTRFKAGDEVFGWCKGAFAEYVRARESDLIAKPSAVTFEQAASAPVAAFSALQALRDKGQLRPGQKVLVNGAAGGVGTYTVQIAKSLGGDVTGVCSTKNESMVRSIGADRVIDYTREDFTRQSQRYDVIVDCIGNHSLLALKRVMTPSGKYIAVGGPNSRWMIGALAGMVAAAVLSRLGSQKLSPFLAKPNREDLALIADLIATGKITPVIDRRYSLREVPDAIRYLEEGHARGKVVITGRG